MVISNVLGGRLAKRFSNGLITSRTSNIEVRSCRGIGGLAALEKDWTSITASLTNCHFHHTFAWHLSYLRNLEPADQAVHFFSFFRKDKPIAIFPLRRVRRCVLGIPLRIWELPSHDHLNFCDFIIADNEDSDELLRLLVRTLDRRIDLAWDALYLPRLPEDSTSVSAIRRGSLSRVVLSQTGKSMRFCSNDLETSIRNTSAHFRRNLRRQRKKLDALGRVEVLFAQDRKDLDRAFEEFVRVEASGWKGANGTGSAIMLDSKLVQFYKDLIGSQAGDKRCLITLLKLDGVAIAAQFCVITRSTLYLLKIAYNEAFSKAGPGSQLLYELLQYCCASPSITHVSLVSAPAWAIGRWNPDIQDVWDAYVFNSNWLGMVSFAAKRLKLVVTAME